MRLKPEHVEELTGHLKGALSSLTPDQIIRLGMGLFAAGAVVAEVAMNGREKRIKAREDAASRLEKGAAKP